MKLTIQSLCKSFAGRDIFADFSLDIDAGVRLCVIGKNGCGKSTLIKMIAGVEVPDAGKIIMPKGLRLGYVEQEFEESDLEKPLLSWMLAIFPDWNEFWSKWEKAVTAKDQEQLLSLKKRQTELETIFGHNPEYRVKKVLSGLGFKEREWLQPLKLFSGGWRERAKLARVLVAGADVLLLDEPTNHLDIEAVEWLENFLKEYDGVLIFVAHDKIFMDKVGTHILYLGGAKPVFRKMNFSQFLAFRNELEEQKRLEAKRIQAEIERKTDFVKRFGAKASKARQASSRQKAAKKLRRELEAVRPDTKQKELCFVWPEVPKSDKIVVSANKLSFSFSGEKPLWPPLTFSVNSGQKIALVGPNGVGKSTLLKLIVGELVPSSGSVVKGNFVRLGYFSQHQMEIFCASSTVLSEVRRLSDPKTTEETLMSVLGLFLLGQDYFDRRISQLSGGERSRLALAALFLAKANFLVLDEPTNHLDLESREALAQSLKTFRGTIIMIAHDRYLLSEVAEEIWSFSDKGVVFHEENFKQYLDRQRAAPGETCGKEARSFSREALKERKREEANKRSSLYSRLKPKQDEYVKLEEELGSLLESQTSIETSLLDPEAYEDREKTKILLDEFTLIKESVELVTNKLSDLEIEILDIKRSVENPR